MRRAHVQAHQPLTAADGAASAGAGPAAPAACGAPGYTFHAASAIAGGDIRRSRAADPASLARECDQTPGCVAFASGGWLKFRAAPLAAAAGGAPEGGRECRGVFVSDEAQQRRWRGSQQPGTEAVAQLHAATRRAAARRRLLQEAAPASAHGAEAVAAAAGAAVPLPRRWSARSHVSTGAPACCLNMIQEHLQPDSK
jgi:hypothetical protein